MDPIVTASLIAAGSSLLGSLFGGDGPKPPKVPNPHASLVSQPMPTPQPPPTQYAPPQVVPPHKYGVGVGGGMNAAMQRALGMLQGRK